MYIVQNIEHLEVYNIFSINMVQLLHQSRYIVLHKVKLSKVNTDLPPLQMVMNYIICFSIGYHLIWGYIYIFMLG